MLREGIHILPTDTTPEIILTHDGTIKIIGRSVEKKFDTYSKIVFDWADEYILDPADVTHVDINLEYIDNIHSARLLHFLSKLAVVKQKGKKLVINWYYEAGDENSITKGKYFSKELKIPFYFILTSR